MGECMILKKPPQLSSLPIITFMRHKGRYKVDRTYQRESGTWKKGDEQYLIDTVLRGFGIPPVFLQEKGDNEFIVDGQQRINTIWKFGENKLELSDKHSKDIIMNAKNKEKNNGKGAKRYSELAKYWQDIFDSYPLPVIYLKDYNDEEIRDLFRRLQHGKPLIPGEILNAYLGDIVLTMRGLAKNKFFTDIIALRGKRYKHYYIAAQLMFLESEGIKDISPSYIYDFFDKNKSLDQNSKAYLKVNKVSNYLVDTFKDRTPELRKPGWIITLYLLTSHLIENYVVANQETILKRFFTDFYLQVLVSVSTGDKELIDFNLAISRGTTSQANIKFRYNVILDRFLKQYNLAKLDENRLFSDDQKITIFRRDKGKCQICSKKLTFGDPTTQFHHKNKYKEGGRTEIDRGLLVCRDCHLTKIHGKLNKQ